MTTNKTYAYIRVSSKDQNEDRQLDALVPFLIPCRQTYMDKQSGKDFNRPAVAHETTKAGRLTYHKIH